MSPEFKPPAPILGVSHSAKARGFYRRRRRLAARIMEVTDPFGNRLRFTEPTGT